MASKRETARSLTAELFAAPTAQIQQTDPTLQAAPPADTPPPPDTPPVQTPPQVVTPGVDQPPPQADPPVTKKFDPASLQNRFTQDPPVALPDVDIPELPPDNPASQAADPKARHAWAELRTKVREFQKAAMEADARAKAADAEMQRIAAEQARVAAELDEQKRREQELTEKLGRLSLSESPEFQQKYDLKQQEVKVKLSKALVKFAGVEAADSEAAAAKILSADAKDLPTMLGDLNPSVAGMILALTSESAAIQEARTQELSNWRQTGAAASVESARKTAAEAAAARNKLAVEALDTAKAYGNPVFASDDPDTKTVAAGISEQFKGFVQGASEAQLIRAAAEGFTAPYLYEVMNQQAEEIAALKDQLAGRNRSSMPPLFAATPRVPQPAAEPPPPNVTPANVGNSARSFAMATAGQTVAQLASIMQQGQQR